MENQIMKTGTTTVGFIFKDGIVLAADKRATAGNFIAGNRIKKVLPVAEKMALTTAGSVSDIQLLVKLTQAELSLRKLRNRRRNNVKEAANMVAGLVYGNIRRFTTIPGVVHFLFAGNDDSQGNQLYDIYPDGSLQNIEKFVASGSGSMMAYGVFESQYKENLSEEEAVKLAIKAVNAALQRDSASGSGIDVMVINKDGVKEVYTKNITVDLAK